MRLLEVKSLTKIFGGIKAVKDCSFDVEQNEMLGLIGPNGSGKTTVLNLISGILRPDDGDIIFKGQKLNKLKPHEISQKGIGRTFQHLRVFRGLSVFENMLVWGGSKYDKEECERRIYRMLELVGLIDFENRRAKNLSYGQQKLLELAAVMMPDPELLLLDEPTAGVNPVMKEILSNYIQTLHKTGKSFIIIEHDLSYVMRLCKRIIVLNYGEKIADGLAEDIRSNISVMKIYLGVENESDSE